MPTKNNSTESIFSVIYYSRDNIKKGKFRMYSYSLTTFEQFCYYKNFAISVFNFLNGVINRQLLCRIEVDVSDYANFTFANIRRPNIVFVHIDNIVSQCGNAYNKNSVCSLIVQAIAHELFHVEQMMSQEMYRLNAVYAKDIEDSVNYEAYCFLLKHKQEIDKVFYIDLDLSYIKSLFANMKEDNKYQYCNCEELYKYTIMNVIFRNDKRYYNFQNTILDKYSTVVFNFENNTNFLIKSNGIYQDQAMRSFIFTTGIMVGIYDRYTLNIETRVEPNRGNRTVIVYVKLLNRCIYPIYNYG